MCVPRNLHGTALQCPFGAPMTAQRNRKHSAPANSAVLPVRWLFAASRVAVVVVDHATGRIAQINPAAARLLAAEPATMLGTDWLAAFHDSCAIALADAAAVARHLFAATPLAVESRAGEQPLMAALSTFHAAGAEFLLLRLSVRGSPETVPREGAPALLDTLDTSATGFVVTDEGLRIEYANRAFLELVGAQTRGDVTGRSIAYWLEFTDADLSAMAKQMVAREAATLLDLMLRGATGPARAVAVTAVAVPDAREPRWGFSIGVVTPDGPQPHPRRTDA